MAGTGVKEAIFLVIILVLAPAVSVFVSGSAGCGSTVEKISMDAVESYDEGYFTENLGQWKPELWFVGAAPFGHIAFSEGCMYLNFVEISDYDRYEPSVDISGYVLKYVFEGANAVAPFGGEATGPVSNYFMGADGSGGVCGVRSYSEIFYENLWDGISLRYYFTGIGPKYEFVLQPGADPSDINIRIEGHSSMNIHNGALAVGLTGEQKIYDSDLSVFYQESKERIDAKFELIDGNKYSFELGDYDNAKTVVIDPLVYSTFVSGSSWEHGRAIAYDSSGNAYVTGQTISSDFPTTTGAYNQTYNNMMDVYVFKLSAAGTGLAYSTYLGGSDDEWGLGINVDSGGNAYVTGATKSTDFPVTAGAYDVTHSSDYDVFVTKLNAAGSALVYSTYIGGTGTDYGYRLELDTANYAYITGRTASSGWPTTSGAYDESHNGMDDAYVLKLNVTGDKVILSTLVGGLSGERGIDLELDSNKNIYVTGYTDYTNTNPFPVTSGAFDESHNGGEDMFVFKLNASFDKLLYSTFIGSSGAERGQGIEIDSSGYAYVGGWTKSSSGFPTTPDAFDDKYKGTCMAVALKLNTTGSGLIYSTFVGGSGNDDANDIAVDPGGFAYIVGETSSSSDFPVTIDAENGTHSGGILDLFLTKLSQNGDKLEYSTFRGGSSADYAYAVVMDTLGALYIGGASSSKDFPTTPGVYQPSFKGNDDAISVKFTFKTTLSPPRNLRGTYGGSFVNLQWDPPVNMGSTGISGYDLYRGTAQGFETLYQSLGNVTAYNDTSVVPGKVYFYYVKAKNTTGESYPSNTFRAADGIPPVITTDNTPASAGTGDDFVFAVDVIDNILLDSVFVEYWYGTGSKTNVSMIAGTGHHFSKRIIIAHTLDTLHYVISANDTTDNWRTTLHKDVPVLDNDKPVFGTDNTSTEAYTASELYFETETFDNIAVSGCWLEYWYGTGTHSNVSMDRVGTDIWTKTIITKNDTTESLHYFFRANDTSDNWQVTAQKDVSVSDILKPTLVEDLTAGPATTGDAFTFDVSVADNIGIASVFVEYWFGTATPANDSMTGQTDGSYKLAIKIPNALDALHYTYHFSDVAANWNQTAPKNIAVNDNDGPEISDKTSTSATTGEALTFTVTAEDNIGIENVYVEYWFGTSLHKNATLTNNMDFEYTITIPETSLEALHYTVYAVDTSGNWNGTPTVTMTISDNDAPGFGKLSFITETGTGSDYEVSCSASDNIAVDNVTVTFWFGGAANETKPMEFGAGEYTAVIPVPAGSLDTLYFYLTAMDANGNSKSSTKFSVTVKDRISPTVEPVGDLNITAGDSVDITVNAADNIGIAEFIWTGAPFISTTNKLSGKVTTPGTYDITVTVKDDAGNSAETGFTLRVLEKDAGSDGKGDKQGLDTTILIALLVVIIVVVIVVVLLFFRRKKNVKPAEEPVAPEQPQTPAAVPETVPDYTPLQEQFPAEQPVQNGYVTQAVTYPSGDSGELQYPAQATPDLPGEIPSEEPAKISDNLAPENLPAQEASSQPVTDIGGETTPIQGPAESAAPPNNYSACPYCGTQVQLYAPYCTSCNNALQW